MLKVRVGYGKYLGEIYRSQDIYVIGNMNEHQVVIGEITLEVVLN